MRSSNLAMLTSKVPSWIMPLTPLFAFNLFKTDLSGANLTEAVLSNANLGETNLREANYRG